MESLKNDLFKKFENKKIEMLNNITGGCYYYTDKNGNVVYYNWTTARDGYDVKDTCTPIANGSSGSTDSSTTTSASY